MTILPIARRESSVEENECKRSLPNRTVPVGDIEDGQRKQVVSEGARSRGMVWRSPPPRVPTTFGDLLKSLLPSDSRAVVATEPIPPFKITHVNPAWELLCGYRASEVTGRTIGSILHGPDTDKEKLSEFTTRLTREQTAATEGPEPNNKFTDQATASVIVTNYRRGGGAFQNEIHAAPLVDDDGCVQYFVAVLRDLAAERLRAERRASLQDILCRQNDVTPEGSLHEGSSCGDEWTDDDDDDGKAKTKSLQPSSALRLRPNVHPGDIPWTFVSDKKNPSKPLNQRSMREKVFILCLGLCLAFNSGYVNGCCLSGLLSPEGHSQSVAGFTGSYSKSALSLASGEVQSFGFQSYMILSFLSGAFISGLINPCGKPYILGPQYVPTFAVGSALLTIASVLSATICPERGIFYFVAMANGLQNGMTSMYTGNLIRTCHLTGTTTDIGLFLGQFARGNRSNGWKIGVLTGLALSFWTGSLISFYATRRFLSLSLLFNAALFFVLGIALVVFLMVQRKLTLWQAASGAWHWESALTTLGAKPDLLDETQVRSVGLSEYPAPTASNPHNDDRTAPISNLMSVFDKIDRNRDGYIDEDELFAAMVKAKMDLNRKDAQRMMAVADKNGDGRLSRDEWENFLIETAMNGEGAVACLDERTTPPEGEKQDTTCESSCSARSSKTPQRVKKRTVSSLLTLLSCQSDMMPDVVSKKIRPDPAKELDR